MKTYIAVPADRILREYDVEPSTLFGYPPGTLVVPEEYLSILIGISKSKAQLLTALGLTEASTD